MDCKCKGCTRRQVGCHSTCEDYKEFQEECERIRKNRHDYNSSRAPTHHAAKIFNKQTKMPKLYSTGGDFHG